MTNRSPVVTLDPRTLQQAFGTNNAMEDYHRQKISGFLKKNITPAVIARAVHDALKADANAQTAIVLLPEKGSNPYVKKNDKTLMDFVGDLQRQNDWIGEATIVDFSGRAAAIHIRFSPAFKAQLAGLRQGLPALTSPAPIPSPVVTPDALGAAVRKGLALNSADDLKHDREAAMYLSRTITAAHIQERLIQTLRDDPDRQHMYLHIGREAPLIRCDSAPVRALQDSLAQNKWVKNVIIDDRYRLETIRLDFTPDFCRAIAALRRDEDGACLSEITGAEAISDMAPADLLPVDQTRSTPLSLLRRAGGFLRERFGKTASPAPMALPAPQSVTMSDNYDACRDRVQRMAAAFPELQLDMPRLAQLIDVAQKITTTYPDANRYDYRRLRSYLDTLGDSADRYLQLQDMRGTAPLAAGDVAQIRESFGKVVETLALANDKALNYLGEDARLDLSVLATRIENGTARVPLPLPRC